MMNLATKRVLYSVLVVILLLGACAPAPEGTPEQEPAPLLMEQLATPTMDVPVTFTPSAEAVDLLPDITDTANPTATPFLLVPEGTPDPSDPIVENISPSSGFIDGGTTITITGKNFVIGKGTIDFYFGDKVATDVICASTTQCTAKTPQQESGTQVTVKAVLVVDNTESGRTDTFTFIALDPNVPIIDNVTPSEGSIRGGTIVTITGKNFLVGKQGINAITRFFFGENEATDVICDFTTRCKMKSPQGLEGIVLIQAQNNDFKSIHTAGNNYDGFKYNGTPNYGCGVFTIIPNNLTVFHPGEDFVIKWVVKNTGEKTWPAGLDLHFSAGANMGDRTSEQIPVVLKPKESYQIKLNAVAPINPGTYYMTWVVEGMGCDAYVAIVVE